MEEHLTPEEEKKRKKKVIWWSGLIVGIIVVIWLITLPITYGNITDKEAEETLWEEVKEDWNTIQTHFSEVVELTKQGIESIIATSETEEKKTEEEVIDELEKEVFPQFEE